MRDFHNNHKVVRSISPIAAGTTGTGQTGKIVDRQGYQGVEFHFMYGTRTATNATSVIVVKEGDTTGAMTSIADADLLGTEANCQLAATTPVTSGASKNVTKRLGYIGKKRYVQVFKMATTISAGIIIGANVVLSHPNNMPVAT